ncbi:MAG: hypothetical protein WBO17_08820 [Sphingorhabdus sp.]
MEEYDWTAFASGFAFAWLLVITHKMRKRRLGHVALEPSTDPATLSEHISRLPPDLRAQILLLKAQGQVIEAIRITRERTGAGLKEAKDIVHAMR